MRTLGRWLNVDFMDEIFGNFTKREVSLSINTDDGRPIFSHRKKPGESFIHSSRSVRLSKC